MPLPNGVIRPVPDTLRRPLATVFLFVIVTGLAWACALAGWPREQVLIVGILAATVMLWVTEALPLFATAFISIAAQLVLLGNPGGWSWLGFESDGAPTPEDFLHAAADPVLLLFFGGLVLARAATKSGLDRHLAALILRPMADTPPRLLLGVILATAAFSPWMSNTATTALMLALVSPILAQIPSGDPFRKAIILAVPLTANVAGISTPIASPPNAIAISYLAREHAAIDFRQWMLIAVPIVAALLAAIRWWLLRLYPPSTTAWRLEFSSGRLSGQGLWVLLVAILTFVLWLTEPWHGVRAALVAMVPVTLFFATTVISREDVNSLDWDVLILIAGGLSLGYSLQATALDTRLASLVPTQAHDVTRLALLAGATLCLGTFFSNTAIASMLMPVAIIAGGLARDVDTVGYALVVALVASMSMALPVSTPPNAMAYATGELSSRDFLRTAGLVGAAGTLLILLVVGLIRPWLQALW